MQDAKIRKPRTDALFRGIKVIKFLSYLRLEFNIDFIHQGMYAQRYFSKHKDTFLKM